MTVAPPPTLSPAYRIEVFGEASGVSVNDVLDLWAREGVVEIEEARRRVYEVLLASVHDGDGLVGVCTAYLQRSDQLLMDMWHYRLFVADAHRLSNVGVHLALRARDLLEERYVSGADGRANGMIYEIENEGLKRRFPEAVGLPTQFTFIGENSRGDHVRVRYFPGAVAPPLRRRSA